MLSVHPLLLRSKKYYYGENNSIGSGYVGFLIGYIFIVITT